MKRYRPIPSLAILLLTTLLFAGCAGKQVEYTRILWPPLPEQPRLEWLKNYYSEDDFPKTAAQKTQEAIVGKPPLQFFQRPFGIAADSKGRVYVSDTLLRNVKVYDFTNQKVYDLSKEGKLFGAPYDLAVDSQDRLYVADNEKKMVLVFAPDHQPLFAFGGKEYLDKPSYLALNERLGRVYVSDAVGNRIAVFDFSGKHLFTFGKQGTGEGELHGPMGLAIDRDNRVYIAEQLGSRIQVFDAEGNYLNRFGKRGDLVADFEGPRDIAIDSDGNLHIADVRKAAFMIYRPDGTLLLYTGGRKSSAELAFVFPTSIWIDANDRIYIADGLNRRFGVWQYFSEAAVAKDPFGLKKR